MNVPPFPSLTFFAPHKDLASIEQLMTQAKIDKAMLDDILQRYKLKLPKP